MRKHPCVAVGLVLAVALTGCGASKGSSTNAPSNGGGAGSSKPYAELRWGMPAFSGVLDWTRNIVAQVPIESLAVNNLMEFETNGKVKPGLASSVEHPNPTTYVYHLKAVKFSDGKPMTAADVVFSLGRNIHAKEAWAKQLWEDVASISELNNSTVVVKLKQPSAVFQQIVALTGQVIEKSAAEAVSEKELGTSGHPLIGTGPWKIDSYKPEVGVRLSRNRYWAGPQPPADNITVNLFKTEASLALALRSGAIVGASGYVAPKPFEAIPGIRQLTAPGATITLVSANTQSPPLSDVHVRRALAYASDAKGMIDALYPHGQAIEDPAMMPASLFAGLGSESEVKEVLDALPKYEFNLAKAKQELAKSAYPHGFSTEIEVEQVEEGSIASAEILSADLAKIGITAKVHEVPSADVAALMFGGKSKLEINNILALYPDPEGIMSTLLAPSQIKPPGSGFNSANYRNAEVDSLMSESLQTKDKAKRLQLIGKLLMIVGNEVPYWPLFTHALFGTLSERYVLPNFSYWTLYWSPWALGVKQTS